MSRKSKVSLTIGAVVMVATIAIFVAIHPMIFPSTILGLCFALYSEVVLFGGFVLVDMLSRRTSTLLSWSGVGVTVGIYGGIVFASSILLMLIRTTHVSWFAILQIVIFVVAFAVILVIASFSARTRERDSKTLLAGAMIQNFRDRLVLLAERTGDGSEMRRLAEELRYVDSSVSVDADVEIDRVISHWESIADTEEIDDEECGKAIKDLDFLIKKRNLQAKALKQGSI